MTTHNASGRSRHGSDNPGPRIHPRRPRHLAVHEDPQVGVLSRLAPPQAAAVQRVQPRVSSPRLLRPHRGVLATAQWRDAVGRGRGAAGRDHRPRRLHLHQHAGPARSEQVQGRAVQVRLHHLGRGGYPQRPGPAAPGGKSLLALAGRQRRAALGQGRGRQLRPERDHPRAGRGPHADTGAEVQGGDGRPVRREHPGHPHYYMARKELNGVPVVVSRTGYTSELGYEIYTTDATRNGPKIWDTVMEAGEPHGLTVIGPCHIRRIEGGILALGCDMWFDTNPFEVDMGYEWMVDLNRSEEHTSEL